MESVGIDAFSILPASWDFRRVELTWPRQQARWRFVSGWVHHVNVRIDVRIATAAVEQVAPPQAPSGREGTQGPAVGHETQAPSGDAQQ